MCKVIPFFIKQGFYIFDKTTSRLVRIKLVARLKYITLKQKTKND